MGHMNSYMLAVLHKTGSALEQCHTAYPLKKPMQDTFKPNPFFCHVVTSFHAGDRETIYHFLYDEIVLLSIRFSQDETIIGGLILILSNNDKKIVIDVLDILLSLAAPVENRLYLHEFIGMVDQLRLLADQ